MQNAYARTAYERAVARSAKTPPTEEPFDLYASPRATGDLTHNANDNGAPPLDELPAPDVLAMKAIDDLFDEAKNFADGEPIATQEMADAITTLHDAIHEAGKVAEALRVGEKKPLDDAVAACQAKWNPYVQPKRGRVSLAKDSLQTLLTPWRAKIAADKAAEAERKRQEALQAAEEAQAAIRASAGNLAAREEAEGLLDDAKRAGKIASKAEKAATTGLGLRTVWVTTVADAELALEWAYGKNPQAFIDMALDMAKEAVRVNGARSLPGFLIEDQKVAT